MPKNKTQGIIFSIIMSVSMALGMEVYNTAVKMSYNLTVGGFSNMTNEVFLPALQETSFMCLIVFLFSELWGSRIGASFAARYCDPARDNPYFCRLMRQVGTIAVMCPSMSMAAALLFSILPGRAPLYALPAVWIGTVMKNFPMAFFWNLFAAAPFTNWAFRRLFPEKEMSSVISG